MGLQLRGQLRARAQHSGINNELTMLMALSSGFDMRFDQRAEPWGQSGSCCVNFEYAYSYG